MTANMKLLVQCVALVAALAPAALPASSLYDEATFKPLITDHKAFRIGDVLTVQVFETSSASTSAETGTRRRNGLNAELSHTGSKVAKASIGVGSDFDGGGRTQRASRLLITLSVTVREILANGDLRLGGEQQLLVNSEQQRVTLEGRVRPQDVSEGNIVQSTRLADARITYIGEGEVSQRQQRAWWRTLLDLAGL